MDTQSPPTTHQAGAAFTDPGKRVDRRRLLAGSLVTGVVAAGAARITGAQDDTATPVATPDTTPDATPGGTPAVDTNRTGAAETDQALAEEAIARADAIISSVGMDRDSVASSTDVSDIDSILTQAGIHRDRAQTVLASGSEPEAVREAMVAGATAWAARLLLEARLSYPGLPSQDVRTSRELVRTHENIVAVSADAASATDANVGFFIANAQQLYASAFELYSDGAFAQAAGTAQAATSLGRIAAFLTTDASMIGRDHLHRGGADDRGMGPFGDMRDSGWPGADDRGMGPFGGMRGPGWPGADRWDDPKNDSFEAEDQEPITVPAPDF